MLCTVSTVKETVDGLDRFVRRNLAGGVDHMVVFLEDPDPEALAFLAEQPHVTAVGTDEAWWGEARPPQLNARQKINANLARAALAGRTGATPEPIWLFHIDGDEVLVPDRAALAAVPADVRVVHAPPLEAVSQPSWPQDRVTAFKRMLDDDELTLLVVLGVIDRAANADYFHGHVKGKSGMRPGLDRFFTLHEVTDAAETDLPPYQAPAGAPVARLLHYESWSGAEFVRKWANILASGQLPAMRGGRQQTAVAIRALSGLDLPPARLQEMLERIYRRTTQDDLATLDDLGLLVELDPDAGTHVPEPLPDPGALGDLLDAFAGLDKRALRAGGTADEAAALLERVSPSGRTRGWRWRRGDRSP